MQILECVDLEGISERMSEIFDKAGNISISPAKTHDGTSTAFIRWKSEDQETALNIAVDLFHHKLSDISNALAQGDSYDSYDIPLFVTTNLYSDGRDIKITRSRYAIDRPSALLFDVDALLPTKKAKAAHKKAIARDPKRIDCTNFLWMLAGFKYLKKDTQSLENGAFRLVATRIKGFGGYTNISLFQNRKYVSGAIAYAEDPRGFSKAQRALVLKLKDSEPEQWQGVLEELKDLLAALAKEDSAAA